MHLIHKSVAITDRSSIGEARRAALSAALSLGFSEERRSDIGIVATEAATNILMHASSGEIVLCPFSLGETTWLDMFALDSGPGITDIGMAMEDGFSSIGTAGQGLGAIARIANESSLHSMPGKGTAYWSRFSKGRAVPEMALGILNIPVQGEVVCGDSFYLNLGETSSTYMVVDGLGHGAGATEAASEAVTTVTRYAEEPLAPIVERTHDALKKTRGAAMSIARVDHDRLTLAYAGVGNISGILVSGTQSRSTVSQNGTLGAVLPRSVQEYNYPVDRNTLLIMYSDGLNTKLSLSSYPGLQNRHPALIAAVLYRDFSRKRDDATVLVAPLGASVA
ncbi:MAG: SpoIIE family protein phosphatase [Acidobacteriaceae bacterium]|nr:SpoIIE family protein phosphatase [Acidobacteriaceae bacterium]